jgi:glycosyltransferase involved in cell wall biosynthesis
MIAKPDQRKLKILYVGNFPNDIRFGSSKIPLCIGEALIRRGHSVDFVFEDPQSWPGNRGLRSYLFPFMATARILRLLQVHHYDVSELLDWDAYIFARINHLLPRERRPVVLMRSMGLSRRVWQNELENSRLGFEKVKLYSRILYPLIRLPTADLSARWVDHVIVMNTEDRDILVNRGVVTADKVSVIPCGVSEKFFVPRNHPFQHRLLFVGSWLPKKGINYLVPAFERLADEYPEITFTICGSLVSEEKVLSAFRPADRNRVKVLPLVDEDAVVQQYQQADIFVFPSLCEGFGLVILEAMAAGLPTVVTPTGGAFDIVEDGVHGLRVPFRDVDAIVHAVQQLVKDATLRRRLSDQARQQATELSWSHIAEMVEAVYFRLLVSAGR